MISFKIEELNVDGFKISELDVMNYVQPLDLLSIDVLVTKGYEDLRNVNLRAPLLEVISLTYRKNLNKILEAIENGEAFDEAVLKYGNDFALKKIKEALYYHKHYIVEDLEIFFTKLKKLKLAKVTIEVPKSLDKIAKPYVKGEKVIKESSVIRTFYP